MRRRLLCLLALAILAQGTAVRAQTDEADPFGPDPFAGEEQEIRIADPIEPVNRGIFWVNDKLYVYLLKPVARGYRIVPEPVRTCVDNVFDNLLFPVRLVGNLLQLKYQRAGIETGRFILNSTLGLAGLFDPAQSLADLSPQPEDFGQTFGRYGIGHGFYLVLPFYGPSSLRDGVGRVGDLFLDPLTYTGLTTLEQAGVKGFDRINSLSLDKDTYEQIKLDALDPYRFVRDAYTQHRQTLVEE